MARHDVLPTKRQKMMRPRKMRQEWRKELKNF